MGEGADDTSVKRNFCGKVGEMEVACNNGLAGLFSISGTGENYTYYGGSLAVV